MAQRPEQIQLSHRMLDAMQDGRIALCDAGTGIGKTYAYLAAATAASAFPTGQIARPIIISTSSIALQNAVLTEYLPLLSCVLMADGILTKPLKAVIRKGKSHYALTELLVCGECGSPYKRVTWARNGKKRIVWRCVSRLEFGTKYCQHSPTLDEGKLHSAILAAMNEYAAIRQEVCPDVLTMAEEARQALSQAGARLLQLKKRMDAVSREQSDVLDRLLVNMADTELNARMKALTDEKESLKAQIADAQQAEVDLEEQAARRRQMWDSIMECAAGYTEFDNELVRQVIQKITVEDAETIHIHFRDSDVVLEQEVE